MSRLRIAPRFALPVDVAGEAIAILAKRGAGKTNTATVLVEEMVRAGVQVVVLDPVGAWWGLRSSHDGKSAGLAMPIIGGAHGDTPLEPTAGHLIADVAVDTGESLLIDVSDFVSKQQIRTFVTAFAERLYRRKAHEKSLLHLVLEEADLFAPEGRSGGDGDMQSAIEAIVRRGRSRGLGITMITQRSAVLSKDILTQADVLIVMRTTGPHDLKAVRLWVQSRGDDHADTVMDSLPGLATGEAWIWNPERDLLDRVQVRRRQTFDSSETPKVGKARVEPKTAAAIDLAKLGAEIEATAERAKENNPAELRKQLRELRQRVARADENTTRLEQQLAERPPAEQVVERVEVPVVSDGQVGRLENVAKELRDVAGSVTEFAGEIVRALSEAQTAARAETVERREEARPAAGPVSARPPARPPSPPTPRPAEAASNGRVSGPQQRILDALAWFEAVGAPTPRRSILAPMADTTSKSSGFEKNLSTLRTAGLINYGSGSTVYLTTAGRDTAAAVEAPGTAEDVQEAVIAKVSRPQAAILRALIAAYPDPLTREELAEQAGTTPSSSGFEKNVSTLKTLGVVDYPERGWVVAQPILFLEERA